MKTRVLLPSFSTSVQFVCRIGNYDNADAMPMLLCHLHKKNKKNYLFVSLLAISMFINLYPTSTTSVVTDGVNFPFVGFHSDKMCIISMLPPCTFWILHARSTQYRLNVDTPCDIQGELKVE